MEKQFLHNITILTKHCFTQLKNNHSIKYIKVKNNFIWNENIFHWFQLKIRQMKTVTIKKFWFQYQLHQLEKKHFINVIGVHSFVKGFGKYVFAISLLIDIDVYSI